MRSGKDEVGRILVQSQGFHRFAFGDGIVKTGKLLFPEKFEQGEKPREFLQEFGQQCVAHDNNVWVHYMFREMLFQGIDPLEDKVVVTDLRQPHEYTKLKESGFFVVRINATEELRKQRIISAGETFNEKAFYHETEQHVNSFEVDFEIDNNSSRQNLINQVEELVKVLEERGE
jgi:dephospho-CoA kinase